MAVVFLSEQEGKFSCNVMAYFDILEEGLQGTGMKIIEEGGFDMWVTCVSS